jgi:DNA polymerase-3 subunit epsilon
MKFKTASALQKGLGSRMNNFIAIDFETAKYSRESACSIGLAKYEDGKVTDTFYSLIRPPVLYIRPDFTDIHGLTVNDIKDAPCFADIWDSAVKPFIGRFPLAAHNAQFDISVLLAVLEWYELPPPRLSYFCTCELSRNAWPDLESHALSALAEHFGIAYNAHNALDDALTCGKLVQMAAEKFDTGKSLKKLLKAAKIKMEKL